MDFNGLPIYEMVIVDDSSEINFVALVDKPAIQRDFVAFKEQSSFNFQVVSEEKRIISGPLMLANTPIYRKPPQVPEECYVVFSKDTILELVQKFFKNGYQANVNEMHNNALKVDGVTMFESWIVDASRGISPMQGFNDVPDGSWFGSFKVDNEAVWQDVLDGKFKGFSIQGKMGSIKEDEKMLMDKINEILQQCEDID